MLSHALLACASSVHRALPRSPRSRSIYVSSSITSASTCPSEPKVEQTHVSGRVPLDPLARRRVYTADQGRNHYKVTVVDYRDVPKNARGAQRRSAFTTPAPTSRLTPQQRRDLVRRRVPGRNGEGRPAGA
jgi:hypothetical protein